MAPNVTNRTKSKAQRGPETARHAPQSGATKGGVAAVRPAASDTNALQAAGQQAAQARSAALALLAELEHAHALIPLLLQALRPAGRARFAMASHQAGIGTDGATRHHERAAALDMAYSSSLAGLGVRHD